MPKKIDLTGKTFGEWTVLKFDETSYGKKHGRYICKCSCGTEKSVIAYSLLKGNSKSCGCKANQGVKGINKIHGMSHTRLFGIWAKMRERCTNDKLRCSKYYCSKGIKVCKEWDSSFLNFYNWAINNGYSDNLSIDRIDNNKGYSPDNCRWATTMEQSHNRTVALIVLHNGEQKHLSDVCRELNIPYKRAYKRYSKLKRKGISFTSADICY